MKRFFSVFSFLAFSISLWSSKVTEEAYVIQKMREAGLPSEPSRDQIIAFIQKGLDNKEIEVSAATFSVNSQSTQKGPRELFAFRYPSQGAKSTFFVGIPHELKTSSGLELIAPEKEKADHFLFYEFGPRAQGKVNTPIHPVPVQNCASCHQGSTTNEGSEKLISLRGPWEGFLTNENIKESSHFKSLSDNIATRGQMLPFKFFETSGGDFDVATKELNFHVLMENQMKVCHRICEGDTSCLKGMLKLGLQGQISFEDSTDNFFRTTLELLSNDPNALKNFKETPTADPDLKALILATHNFSKEIPTFNSRFGASDILPDYTASEAFPEFRIYKNAFSSDGTLVTHNTNTSVGAANYGIEPEGIESKAVGSDIKKHGPKAKRVDRNPLSQEVVLNMLISGRCLWGPDHIERADADNNPFFFRRTSSELFTFIRDNDLDSLFESSNVLNAFIEHYLLHQEFLSPEQTLAALKEEQKEPRFQEKTPLKETEEYAQEEHTAKDAIAHNVLQKSCMTAKCHDNNGTRPMEALITQRLIPDWITSTEALKTEISDGLMPPEDNKQGIKALSPEEKTAVLEYIDTLKK